MKKKVGPWKTAYFCKFCHCEVNYYTKMYSDGRCPWCGEKAETAITIIKTYEKPFRWIKEGPWYARKKHREFKSETYHR